MKKPISTCTVKDLIEHIDKACLESFAPTHMWYVVISEIALTIDLIEPDTLKIHSIRASKICYE